MKINVSSIRLVGLTSLAMIAFAANSLLCRLALKHTEIDAVSFTSLRLISGALILWLLIVIRGGSVKRKGNIISAFALFMYAAGFSLAYINLAAGIGALLLFGAVQITMISYGLWIGERFKPIQLLGFLLALIGILILFLPSVSAPPLASAVLMIVAGIAWGIYSLRGKNQGQPIEVSASNFILTIPITIIISLVMWNDFSIDTLGFIYAILSGGLASGLGYAMWYSVLPELKASSAAVSQLSVPVLTALAGIVFLGELLTLHLLLSACLILGGIALVIYRQP